MSRRQNGHYPDYLVVIPTGRLKRRLAVPADRSAPLDTALITYCSRKPDGSSDIGSPAIRQRLIIKTIGAGLRYQHLPHYCRNSAVVGSYHYHMIISDTDSGFPLVGMTLGGLKVTLQPRVVAIGILLQFRRTASRWVWDATCIKDFMHPNITVCSFYRDILTR